MYCDYTGTVVSQRDNEMELFTDLLNRLIMYHDSDMN